MIEFTVNGQRVRLDLPRKTPLLSVLRNDLELNGPKFGCGLGECGACTILIDRRAARACVFTLNEAEGRSVTTLEGLGSKVTPHPVQAAFIAASGTQCGYCLNGMIMTTVALLTENPSAGEAEIRDALRYNLCRCGAHVEILSAAMQAAAVLKTTVPC